MQVAIEAKNLHFGYGATKVLEGVNFQVQQGDYVALIGPNGGGKTTLLKLLLGLLKPSVGEVLLFNQSPQEAAKKGKLGYVPQLSGGRAFDFPATIFELVASGRTAKLGLGKPLKPEDRDIIEQALSKTGLQEDYKKLVPNLSGGQRQRAFIARALAAEPEVLFLDEPVAGVDLGQQGRFYELLSGLNQQEGLTLVFVSHDVGVMSRQANRFLCLNKKLVCHESPDNFLKQEFMDEIYGKTLTPLTHHH